MNDAIKEAYAGLKAANEILQTSRDYWKAEAEKHQWISIKDRTPESHTDVLTVSEDRGIRIEYFGVDDFVCGVGVTHWMPLPQKPESEDDA